MPARPKTAVAGMKIRLREPLRARLEAAAKRRAVSLNKELVARLEQSFFKDDAVGGPEIRQLANLMTASFALAGKRTGDAKGLAKWTTDSDCYLDGMLGVIDGLMRHAPAPLTSLQAAAIESRVRTFLANQQRRQ